MWHDYVTDKIRELRMTRVTYGVASSSYHSTQALQESGKNHGPNPHTVNAILNDFTVSKQIRWYTLKPSSKPSQMVSRSTRRPQ